jgi:hypothetical protein
MRVLGRNDEGERQHELAELGSAATAPGPIGSLCETRDLAGLKRLYEAALADLSTKVAGTKSDDPKLPYYRTLMVLTKKVELDLAGHVDALTRFYRELDEMHDFVHEIYPAG